MQLLEFYTGLVFYYFTIGFLAANILHAYSKSFASYYDSHNDFVFISNRIFLLSGVIYILSFFALTIIRLQSTAFYSTRIFGEYWFGYWLYPLVQMGLVIFCQIKTRIKIPVILLCFIFLLFPMEEMIIFLVQQGDYLQEANDQSRQILEIGKFLIAKIVVVLIALSLFSLLVKIVSSILNGRKE